MDVIEACKIIIGRSPNAAEEAIRTIAATHTPTTQATRLRAAVERAYALRTEMFDRFISHSTADQFACYEEANRLWEVLQESEQGIIKDDEVTRRGDFLGF